MGDHRLASSRQSAVFRRQLSPPCFAASIACSSASNRCPPRWRFWQDTYGATIGRQDHAAVSLMLRDGGEIVLHADASLPEQALYLLVDDVREMHASRAALKLDFRTPPTRGSRGYFATIRDPFGVVLQIADASLDPTARASDPDQTSVDQPSPTAFATAAHPSAEPSLFGSGAPRKHKPDRAALAAIYGQLGRTADDLPYTSHFETLYDAYMRHLADPKPGPRRGVAAPAHGQKGRCAAQTGRCPIDTAGDRRRRCQTASRPAGRRDRPARSVALHASV